MTKALKLRKAEKEQKLVHREVKDTVCAFSCIHISGGTKGFVYYLIFESIFPTSQIM